MWFPSVLNVIAGVYSCTWFVWPFVLVVGFAYGLKALMRENRFSAGLICAALALLVILVGVITPGVMWL